MATEKSVVPTIDNDKNVNKLLRQSSTASENVKNICDQCGVEESDLKISETSLKLVGIADVVSTGAETVKGIGNEPESAKILQHDEISTETTNLDCLLLEDSSLNCAPLQLRQLITNADANNYNQGEFLLILIYIVAVETGFCMRKQCSKCLQKIVNIPTSTLFHSKNVHFLTRKMPLYTQNVDKTHFVMHLRTITNMEIDKPTMLYSFLTCYITGDLMVVTLTPHRDLKAPGSSTCLSVGRYVLKTSLKTPPLYKRFRKLKELSKELRNNIFLPIKVRQLSALDALLYPSFCGLPPELYDNIFKYLTKNQLCILANVNRKLHQNTINSKFLTGGISSGSANF